MDVSPDYNGFMKALLILLLVFPLLAAAGVPPDLTLFDLDYHKAADLSDFKGSVVIMNFWATWCGPCRVELPLLQKMAQARAGDGVKILTVNLDDKAAKAKSFVERQKLTLPVYRIAPEAIRKLGLVSIPVTMVLNKNGELVAHWTGLDEDFESRVGKLIEDLQKK
jgi:thiol-disulfide isomerase/thioredoxin